MLMCDVRPTHPACPPVPDAQHTHRCPMPRAGVLLHCRWKADLEERQRNDRKAREEGWKTYMRREMPKHDH